MLAVENRNNTDLRTIGALFYYCCDELEYIKFLEVLQLISRQSYPLLPSKVDYIIIFESKNLLLQ